MARPLPRTPPRRAYGALYRFGKTGAHVVTMNMSGRILFRVYDVCRGIAPLQTAKVRASKAYETSILTRAVSSIDVTAAGSWVIGPGISDRGPA